MLMKIWNWLLAPAFAPAATNEIEETRAFMRRLNDAKLGEDKEMARSWHRDSNWL